MTARAATWSFIVTAVSLSFLCLAADKDFLIRSDVPLVLLDVSVQDHSGNFVSGLTKENFRVFENGRPQSISVFTGQDVPVTAGILMDQSFSMTPKVTQAITAAMTLIHESNPHDEVFIVHFNNKVKFGLPKQIPFSGDRQQLQAALLGETPRGKTALYDAVEAGLEHLTQGRRDKKTLIVISDGGDNASHTTRQDMLAKVESSLATVYTIGLFDEDSRDRDPRILSQLARISGGDVYFPHDPSGMVPACRRIARDIRARYTVGYAPAAENGKNNWRNIRVEVAATSHGKLVARTRRGYLYGATGESQ
jgi:Ca-activated chloride channel family protein